ncbi:hypothetical protein MKQ70_35045 [Chitinophaga sedimenti]|uniref:hypothetical protein n=1 Tax=Chitinophaga sedimenti TaxID=2033606 RepID=UPI0020064169|nr:hypothetical protein [Chitinophaga sedimenti]MCK7559876.1 hypothetical protein [Chitinophaga sedimenti]
MVQVEGDTTGYFKVDYSRTRNARLVVGESGPYKTQDASYRDSVVMIKLPEGIKSGNFTLNLTAYGNDGSVSNTVTYNVQLIQPAGLSTLNGSLEKDGYFRRC